MGHCSAPPSKVCGRSRIYSASQNTSGIETKIQSTVRFEAVWHQLDSLTWAGAGGDATAMVSAATSRALLAARRAKDFAVGDELRSGELVGAGDAVDVRDGFLVGEGSKVGKLPRGVWRVETIVAVNRVESSTRLGRCCDVGKLRAKQRPELNVVLLSCRNQRHGNRWRASVGACFSRSANWTRKDMLWTTTNHISVMDQNTLHSKCRSW
jgi:hypothetical protein